MNSKESLIHPVCVGILHEPEPLMSSMMTDPAEAKKDSHFTSDPLQNTFVNRPDLLGSSEPSKPISMIPGDVWLSSARAACSASLSCDSYFSAAH